jgi:hypothetical protein
MRRVSCLMVLRPAQYKQLGDGRGDPPRLVAGEEMRRRAERRPDTMPAL